MKKLFSSETEMLNHFFERGYSIVSYHGGNGITLSNSHCEVFACRHSTGEWVVCKR